MALSQRLQQRQNQSLVVTPQLAQSIKLLQLNHAELLDFVKEEIEKNPLLELATEQGEKNDRESSINRIEPDSQDNRKIESADAVIASHSASIELQADNSIENLHDTGTAGAERQEFQTTRSDLPSERTGSSSSPIDEGLDYLANIGEAPDLTAHLERQIACEFKGEQERQIATYIAHGLDEDGYFREPPSETAARNQTTVDIVLWVLEQFQNLEPTGIGARNLAECLELQLRERNRLDPAMQTLLKNINLLAKHEYKTLMGLCEVSKEDFNDMLTEIRALDPRPARRFDPALAETVVPDVIITQSGQGDWHIELNPETLPRVLVDRDYHIELTRALDDESRQFVSQCMENANWLTKSLDQRAQTVLKVVGEIVKKQDRFFAEGVQHLKPMTLKQVADKIKMHESTVSRVTTNKFLICDQGTFELKYFFSSAIASSEGETAVSAEVVKYRIQKLVDAESPEKILSDEHIVEKLQETGIAIARRTVAKYREALHIGSSVERRRQKKNRV
ncbi:MAG: RNA polymerase factor sigma-54 [Pseudomonadota bacterium]